MTIQPKDKYEQNQIKGADTTEIWNYVNMKLNSKVKENLIGTLNIDGLMILDDELRARHFNRYFSEIGKNIKESIEVPLTLHDISEQAANSNSLFMNPTDEYEIVNIIQK